ICKRHSTATLYLKKPLKIRYLHMPNTSRERSLVMAEIMTPNMENFSGTVHGGNLLSLLDKVAYACAARYAACSVVTLSVDNVLFKEPIYVGELVNCLASVNYVGRTSM